MAIVVKNKTKDGKESSLIMTDFVDATMRRTKEVVIDKTSGTVSVLVEGETTPQIIHFTETENSVTYTWPDGFSNTISFTE